MEEINLPMEPEVSKCSIELVLMNLSPEVIERFIITNVKWNSNHLRLGGTAEKVEALLESTLHDGGESGLELAVQQGCIIYLTMRMDIFMPYLYMLLAVLHFITQIMHTGTHIAPPFFRRGDG